MSMAEEVSFINSTGPVKSDETDWKALAIALLQANTRHLEMVEEYERSRAVLLGALQIFDAFYRCEACGQKDASYLASCLNPLHSVHDTFWAEINNGREQ